MLSTLAIASVAGSGGPWMAGFGFLFFLIPLFWIGLFFLIFALVGRRWRRSGWGPGHPGMHHHWSPSRSAESSLAERFAQGDIDEKEYRARLEVLRANSPQPPVR